MNDNGQHPTFPTIAWQVPPDRRRVIYRGRVRQVYGVVPARHQRHRYFVLAFRRGRAPRQAPQAGFGPRGQRRVVAVLVRSDHCRSLGVQP